MPCVFFVMQKITLTSKISTFRDKKTGGCTSSRAFGSQGGSVAFCLKVCDVLAQHNEFSATLRSRLLVCKVRNERSLSYKCCRFSKFSRGSMPPDPPRCSNFSSYFNFISSYYAAIWRTLDTYTDARKGKLFYFHYTCFLYLCLCLYWVVKGFLVIYYCRQLQN